MPVTIRPTSNRARLIQNAQRSPQNSRDMLHGAVGSRRSQQCLELLQSSFDDRLPPACKAAKNGFVQSVFDAYSYHHHLKIRPEDIWLAVLTQFSFYVNAHAEELRAHFVQHEGQKELDVKYESGDRYSVDFADFAQQIGKLIEENVVDAELRSWLMPTFSTTTEHDVVVASIAMMGTLQAYFSYGCTTTCGLPSVTLQGERSDYETILHKLDKLRQYGKETEDFAALLEPILRRFIRAFDDPGHAEILDFWNRIFSHHHMFSGDDYYSGWITAFCFWNSKGRRIGYQSRKALDLDGAKYYNISSPDVPSGYLTVPVKVDDNGDEFDAETVAGSVGMICSSSGDEDEEGLVGLDTVEPMSGWWMYEKISAMAT